VVPQHIYPESTHSSSSGSLNKLLKTKLREHALVLRELSSRLRSSGQLSGGDIITALRSQKEKLLSEIYRVMSATLGVPPQPNDKFVWDYYDKDGKAGRWEGSAKQFYAVRRKCSLLWSNGIIMWADPSRHSQTRTILLPTLSL
jgi:bleomycin hydrolase